MSLKHTFAVSAIALLVSQSAMAAESAGSEGNVSISDTDLATMFRDNGFDISQVPEPAVENNLKVELTHRFLVSTAKKAGFEKSPEVQRAMQHAADEELIRRYVLSQSQVPAGYPTDADLRTAYDQNKNKLTLPKRVRVSDIYLAGVDDATQIRAKALDADLVVHPDNFPDAAAKNGGDRASAVTGGDWIAVKNLTPDIVKALDAVQKGGVTKVVADKTGFHIVRLIDRAEESTPTFEEVRPNLVAALREQKTRELSVYFMKNMVTTNPVNVNQAVLARISAPGTVPTAAAAPAAAPASR